MGQIHTGPRRYGSVKFITLTAVLIGAILLPVLAFGATCKTPEEGRAWHSEHGQTFRVPAFVQGKEVWLWVNPDGFDSLIETVSPVLWCWLGDVNRAEPELTGTVYSQQIRREE